MSSLETQFRGGAEMPFVPMLAKTGAAAAGAVVQRVQPAPAVITPEISPASPIVVTVKKPHTTPAKVPITLKVTGGKARSDCTLRRTMTATSGNIKLLRADGKELTFTVVPGSLTESEHVFTAGEINAGVKLFAVSDSASSNLNDYHLKLSLPKGPTAGPPFEVDVVAVSLTLIISPPKTASGPSPAPLSEPPPTPPGPGPNPTDKWFGGVQLNAQDTDNNQRRAQLRVVVTPSSFAGDLVLRQVVVSGNKVGGLDNKLQLFDDEAPGPKQSPPIAEAPKSNPIEFNASTAAFPGREFFAQGKTGSKTKRDTGFQVGIKNVENDGDRVALTVAIAPILTVDQNLVVVKKPHTSPVRRIINVRTSAAFGRSGTLTRSALGPPIRLLSVQQPAAGTETVVTGAGHTFTAAELTKGIQLFAESLAPSGTVDDYELTLTLAPGPTPVASPATIKLTAVELTLDVGLSRTAPGVLPQMLSQGDKINPGRFLQVRDPAFTHKRAMILLRSPKPFLPLTVALESLTPQVRAFGVEGPASGQVAQPARATFTSDMLAADPNGLAFFVEGDINPSGGLRDTGFRFGIDGLENDADRIAMTVLKGELQMAGVAAANKTTIGGLVVRNNDGNNAPRKRITLRQVLPGTFTGSILLQCASDKVTFHDALVAGNKIAIDGNSNRFANATLPRDLFIEGFKFSDAMRDIEISLDIETAEKHVDAVRLTVLWVDKPDMAFAGPISLNNDKRNAYKSWTKANTFDLGLQEYNATFGARIGFGSEASAKVHPTKFNFPANDLKLERDFFFRDYSNGVEFSRGDHNAVIPPGNDTGPAPARDDNPDPDDKIYDWDAAGLLIPNLPKDTIRRTRNNFNTFASITVEGISVRCSEIRQYFIRFSQKQTAAPAGTNWQVINPPDVATDMQAGNGTTNVTVDLK